MTRLVLSERVQRASPPFPRVPDLYAGIGGGSGHEDTLAAFQMNSVDTPG